MASKRRREASVATREYLVENPTTQEVLDRILEIALKGTGTLVLQAIETGNELAGRRGESPVARTFTLDMENLEFPTTKLSFTAQDLTTKKFVSVSQLADRKLHITVVE